MSREESDREQPFGHHAFSYNFRGRRGGPLVAKLYSVGRRRDRQPCYTTGKPSVVNFLPGFLLKCGDRATRAKNIKYIDEQSLFPLIVSDGYANFYKTWNSGKDELGRVIHCGDLASVLHIQRA